MDGKILLDYIDNQKKTKIGIARDLKISKQALFQYFKSQTLEPETKEKFESYFGEKIFSKNIGYTQKRLNKKNRNDDDDVIEFYDSVKGQQGKIVESLLPTTKQDISGFIKKTFFKNADWVIRGIGNSMMPNYPPNAYIGIRKIDKRFVNPGSVYALDVGSDLLVKRIYYKDDNPETGIFLCISDNTMIEEHGVRKGRLKYPPKEINVDDVLSVLKVTDVYKPNEIEVI